MKPGDNTNMSEELKEVVAEEAVESGDTPVEEVTPVLKEVVPEVAEPAADAVDENILGKLEPQEMGTLIGMSQQGRAVVQHIGELEIEKNRLIGQLASMETQQQQVLQGIAKRLGIPQGTQWHVTHDGHARKVSQPQ